MVPLLASRLEGGGNGGCWTYTVPVKSDRQAERLDLGTTDAAASGREASAGNPEPDWAGDNSNTQFAFARRLGRGTARIRRQRPAGGHRPATSATRLGLETAAGATGRESAARTP